MNWRKTFVYLFAVLLLLGLLPVLSFAQGGAGQTAAAARIEADLLEQLAAGGTSDMIVVMAEQADLSPAYSMGWKERGEFVYNTLKATAERSQAHAKALLEANGLKYQTFIAGNELYVWAGNLQVASALAALPEVAFIYATRTYYIDPVVSSEPAEPAPQALDWGIVDTGADDFWTQFGMQGDGIVVANIDTGVQWNHPALDQAYRCPGNPTDPACWYDPSNVCGGTVCDNNGHGTHTMGTMVGDDDPSLTYQVGMAPNAQWIACKGCETNSCSNFALNACADWIVAPNGNPANRPHIVNNSWGGGGCNTWYQAKVQAWRAAGIFPAFSAGNNYNCNSLGSPGDYQESFASAAHNSGRNIADFSSRGPSCFGHDPYTKPNISAPGVDVCSSVPTNSWDCTYSGTSMASPHSAGAVALLWSCNPSLIGQIDQTFQILQDNADTPPAGNCGAPPDGEGNYTYGYGYLNVYNAGLSWCGSIGYLDGHVTDASTGNPIAGATVSAVRSGFPPVTATTDPNGYYTKTLMVGTYTVTASAYGYLPETVAGVAIVTDTVTTQDFALTPAEMYVVSGTVTDANTGWPLYARLQIAGYPYGPVWTDPVSGFYQVTLAAGITYTFHVSAWVDGYLPEDRPVGPLTGDRTEDFALLVDVEACVAPGYTPQFAYLEDFEANNGGYTHGGTNDEWEWGTPLIWPNRCASGSKCWGTDLDGNYENNSDYWLLSPVINLSGASAPLVAKWWQAWSVESATWDHLYAEVSINGGPWTTMWSHTGGTTKVDWTEMAYDVSAAAGGTVQFRWRLTSDASVTYEGYYIDRVSISSGCVPTPGGLVVGNVYDANTLEDLTGALVANDSGYQMVAAATPDDPNVGDAFYTLFSPPGDHLFTATMGGGYQPDVETVTVVQSDTVRQDFYLPAGFLDTTPDSMAVTLEWGMSETLPLALTNSGGADAAFEILEKNRGFQPMVLGVPVANEPRTDAEVAPFSRQPVAPLAVGDPLFSINVEAPTGDYQCLGVEWADGYWWVTGGNNGSDPNKLYKLDEGGNLVASYDQPASCSVWGGRDLAYDGTYLYTGCDDGQVHQFDPVAEAWVGSFPGPIAPPRALAYDPNTDHFWTASWSSNIYEFDRNGTVIHQWPDTYTGKYGMAWDSYSPTGPYLWVWTQNPGVVAAQYYFDGSNLTPTGLVWQGVNPGTDIAGGATTVPDHPAYLGQLLFAGLHQATPDTVWVYDLAVATPPPDVPWLSEEPVSGTVPAGGSLPVSVTFDAGVPEVTQPGEYYATMRFKNDTPYGTLEVPVTMTVLPAADMGKVAGYVVDNCTGGPVEATITFQGGVPITQTTSNPGDGYYAIWLVEGTYPVVFSADGYLDYATQVTVVAGMTTTLDAILVPDRACIAVSPPSFEFWVLTGTQESDLLSLTNNGGQDLDYTIFEISGTLGFLDIGPAQAGQVTAVAESKGMADEQGGGLLPEDTGGPDPFGYTYKDSDEPGGPMFDWIEISGTGQNLGLTDDSHIFPLNLPFPFNFYGVDYNQIAVGSNGSVYFVDSYLGLGNVCLPGDGGYGVWDFIVGMWDDLNPGAGGAVYYEALNYKGQDIAVVEWYQVPHFGTTDDMTYEIILFPNGSILIQYLDPSNEAGSGATVGIQGYWENPSYYLEYSCNAAALDYNLAICFAYPGSPGCIFGQDVPWVWEEPVSGTVPALSTGEVAVTVTSYLTDPLPLGTYTATLLVSGNDPVKGSENVPVIMHIIEELARPLLSADTYGCGLPGTTVTHTFILTNTGPTAGSFDIAVEYASWPATPSVSSIGPLDVGESATFQVYVDIPPLEAVLGSDLFTVTATYQNPPYPGDVAYGETCAQVTPEVSIGPDGMGEGYAGEAVTYTLTVTNLGDYADHFLLEVSGAAWTTTLSITDTGTLVPGAAVDVLVTVQIPAGASAGDTDTATLSATSATDPAISDTATVTTGVLSPYYYYYLPIISKNW